MPCTLSIAIVGEFNAAFAPHEKTNAALGQMCSLLALHIDATWLATTGLYDEPEAKLSRFDAIWLAPGIPYRSPRGALNTVKYARDTGTPLLATFGGCPHDLPLTGRMIEVHVEPRSRVAEIYGATRVSEQYYCNVVLDLEGLVTVGRDAAGEARILTLEEHPFFIATVFVPQVTSTPLRPHPLIAAFVRAAFTRRTYLG